MCFQILYLALFGCQLVKELYIEIFHAAVPCHFRQTFIHSFIHSSIYPSLYQLGHLEKCLLLHQTNSTITTTTTCDVVVVAALEVGEGYMGASNVGCYVDCLPLLPNDPLWLSFSLLFNFLKLYKRFFFSYYFNVFFMV